MIKIKKIVKTSSVNIYFEVENVNVDDYNIGDVLTDREKIEDERTMFSATFFQVNEVVIDGNNIVFRANELTSNLLYAKISKLQSLNLYLVIDDKIKRYVEFNLM